MAAIETTKDQYLYSIIDWYTHFRKMEGAQAFRETGKGKSRVNVVL